MTMTAKTATKPKAPRKSKPKEMTITLATLVEIDACIESRREFVRVFGEDGSPTAKEVFIALAKGQRHDWLFWLAAHLKTFAIAVGNLSEGNFHCAVQGEFSLNTGFMITSDSATVRAYDSATVRAYDSATVRAYDSATVRAYGSATVRAYDSATVRAYDSATVMLNHWSLRVTFSIKSLMACVVDRRNGDRPQLLLAETEQTN
jgi:hypothetical protein